MSNFQTLEVVVCGSEAHIHHYVNENVNKHDKE